MIAWKSEEFSVLQVTIKMKLLKKSRPIIDCCAKDTDISISYRIKSAKDAISKLSLSRVVYKLSCAGCGACYVGETNRQLATRVCEHLTFDKNSHISQHIHESETCRALCSDNCFSILDTVSSSFQLKTKGALHIGWENPSLNKQVNHVNLTLSF